MAEQLHQQVTALRKAGNLQEAWDLACPGVQERPEDTYLKSAFFWLCYAYLKEVQVSIKQRASGNNDNYRPNLGEQERISFLLNWVTWLNMPAGGFEYRSILLTFQHNLEYFPEMIVLLCSQQSSLFDAGDEQPYVNDKGESPSLMLKFARKCAKGWQEHDSLHQSIGISDLVALLNSIRGRMRDNKNGIWLDYDQAKCLIMSGNLAEARDFVIPVLRKKQSEPWAWGALAATYFKSDPPVAILLFAQGLLHVGDEKFAIKLWIGLAPLLASAGYPAEASMCVKRAITVYQSEGWKLKSNLEKLSQTAWYDNEVSVGGLTAFLKQSAQGASQYLLGDARSITGIVENIHQSGKGFHVYVDRYKSYSVPIGLFKSKSSPIVGNYVALRVTDDSDVVEAVPSEAVLMADSDIYSGKLKVTDKGFGFVEDTFVPPFLISSENNGEEVQLTRVMAKDKKKGNFGWKAINLKVIS